MTDITELAQSLKAEDISSERMEWLRKLADMEYCANNPGHWLMNLKETNYLASLALQCLESNSTLVEALEKAQQRIAELENYAEAEAVGADRAAEDGVYWMKRCKELESRTVKLPKRHSMLLREDFNDDYHTEMAYKADEVQASLAAVGIKVEAE